MDDTVQPRNFKARQTLPQICAVGAKNLLMITHRTSLGFVTILIPQIQQKDTEIPVTFSDVTWIGSINLFLVPLGGIVSGPISRMVGNKTLMLLVTIPFIMTWLILYYAFNSTMLLIGLGLSGLAGGLLEAPSASYGAEMTQPNLRGILSATSSLSLIIGVFTAMLSGSLIRWRELTLINILYPTLSLIALLAVPESPEWLAQKGLLKDAERSLCWLRGWVSPSEVKDEFLDLCKTAENNRIAGNLSSDTSILSINKWKPYVEKSFYRPYLLVLFAFFVSSFRGSVATQTFAVLIFDQLESPIDSYQATVYFGIAQLAGATLCAFIISFTGKRKLAFFSYTCTALCYLLTSAYAFLNQPGRINKESLSWTPVALIIGASLFTHMCARLLPWLLTGEVFPVAVRHIATGSISAIAYIFSSIMNKCFLYMLNSMHISGILLFFAIVNISGCLIMLLVLPETEGRTLTEIESYFAGDRPTRNQDRNPERCASVEH